MLSDADISKRGFTDFVYGRTIRATKLPLPTLVHCFSLAAFSLWALLPHYHITSHLHAHAGDHQHHLPGEYYSSDNSESWGIGDSHAPGEGFGTGHYHGKVFHEHRENVRGVKKDHRGTEGTENYDLIQHNHGPGPWLATGENIPHSHYWEDLNLSYLTSDDEEARASLSEPPYRQLDYELLETRHRYSSAPRGPPLS